MLTFPINPQDEIRELQQGKYKFTIGFRNITQTKKDTILSFFQDTSEDTFYYWTIKDYTLCDVDDYFVIQNTKYVISKDDDTGYDNLYTSDTIITTTLNPETDTSYTDSTVINAPITVFIEQQYYSGDVEYLHIYNSEISVKIRQADSNKLIISVKTPLKAFSNYINLKTWQYDIYGVYYNYLVYAVSIKEDKVVLSHNNTFVEIDLGKSYNVSNLEIESFKNINNLIISNGFAEGEFLKGFTRWIGNSMTITVASNSVSLSKSKPTYLYGQPRYIVEFDQDEVSVNLNANDTYTFQMRLKEVI